MNIPKIAARTIVAGAIAASAAFGATAQARAVSSAGCTATPLAPTYSHTTSTGVKVLRFSFRLSCAGFRSVQVQHQIREQDVLTSQLIKNSTFTRSFPVGGNETISVYSAVPDTELGAEELYHRLRIQVTVLGVPQPWSGWDSSAVISI